MGNKTTENSARIEAWGELELGVIPKVGARVELSRSTRAVRMIEAAAGHAEIGLPELEDRFADADDRVRDVLTDAVHRAREVEDDEYLDVLGRLVAGALDAAHIDEHALLTNEIIALEPVHLRTLLNFFHYGRGNAANSDPKLTPRDADWAQDRWRPNSEVADVLGLSGEATAQVCRRLERDGLIYVGGATRTESGEVRNGPTPWSARALGILFPQLEVELSDEWTRKPDASTAANEPDEQLPDNPVRELPSTQVLDRTAIDELVWSARFPSVLPAPPRSSTSNG